MSAISSYRSYKAGIWFSQNSCEVCCNKFKPNVEYLLVIPVTFSMIVVGKEHVQLMHVQKTILSAIH